MTQLPEPPVSAEVDLRDFAFMPLDVLRLRDSELAAEPDGEVFRCAVLSWCVSWHQVPAASLPDDDSLLCRLLGFGRDLRGWKRVRDAGGLRGWVQCADGRLYHPVVAEKARDAWRGKMEQRWRTEAARVKKHNQRHGLEGSHAVQMPHLEAWIEAGCPQGQPLHVPRDIPAMSPPVPRENASKGQGEGEGQGQGDIRKKTSSSPAAKPRPAKKPPHDFALTPDLRAWAAEHAPLVDAEAELARFRDHTFATARTDWPGTLRNWLRKAQDHAQAKGQRSHRPTAAPDDEPEWRRAQRERNEAALGPFAARRKPAPETIDMEPPNGAASLLG